MDKSINIIKKHLKLKEPIKLRFKNLQNGNKSLYLDIYWKGHRSYHFLHLYLIPEIDEMAHEQNQEVLKQAYIIKSKKIIELLMDNSQQQKEKAKEIFLLDFVQQFANDRKKANQDINKGRYSSIITLKRHLEKFGARNTLLNQVDVKFCKCFIDYLRNAIDLRTTTKNQRKLADGTIFLKYSIFRSILQEAAKQKLIVDNPFSQLSSNYRLKRPDSTRSYLNRKELDKVIASSCNTPQLKEAFLFSCFTGLRKSDVLNLTWEEIIKENNKYYINKKIQKTQRWLKIPLSAHARQWLPHRSTSLKGIVFSAISHSSLYKQLKEWLQNIGVENKNITFHMSRHTFATLELSLGASLYTVSTLLGHKSITTTQVYAKVINKEKERAIGLIDKSFK